MERREFILNTSPASASMIFGSLIPATGAATAKERLAIIGMGHPGTGFWGRTIIQTLVMWQSTWDCVSLTLGGLPMQNSLN